MGTTQGDRQTDCWPTPTRVSSFWNRGIMRGFPAWSWIYNRTLWSGCLGMSHAAKSWSFLELSFRRRGRRLLPRREHRFRSLLPAAYCTASRVGRRLSASSAEYAVRTDPSFEDGLPEKEAIRGAFRSCIEAARAAFLQGAHRFFRVVYRVSNLHIVVESEPATIVRSLESPSTRRPT